jgi:hypothetical protein
MMTNTYKGMHATEKDNKEIFKCFVAVLGIELRSSMLARQTLPLKPCLSPFSVF